MSDRADKLSPNKQALLKIRELKEQLHRAQQDCGNEAIAIVSMACRFPQSADTPEKFWQSLIDQTNLVSEIPDDRWDLEAFHDDDPDVPGKMYARRGVFLDDIDQMDPEFFGISPREATWIDPQQRLLMEVGWEAIERSGWVPEQIGESTGVFVGWMHNDYQNEASDSFLNLNPYIATGAAGSFLCGRLAYYMGLQGPSVAVDTACSSSLVALHLAIQSLQRRDCDRALVGGVNAMCSPTTNILTCKLKALSPHGHSRAFDAAADGYLRGEGCGVVTLRRLSDAEKDGDPIIGIVRGSAVGHNGFSSGLTAPNPKAQEKVIRQALHQARIQPDDVLYLEAHGTGTELGDPIEMNAASAALRGSRTDKSPLLIGSVKTNIGHLEAAAGMAGLIKVLLAMQNDCIPGQLNFETPNPHIPWDQLPVKVLTETTPWPEAKRRIAGVSAFGMSGTNSHVIIEAPSAEHNHGVESGEDVPQIITLSAKTQDALFELADAYAKHLKQNEFQAANIAFTTNTARSHFEYRGAIVTNSCDDAARQLAMLARGTTSDEIRVGTSRKNPRVAWQFTGQGAQFVGMGRGLYDSEPVFKAVIDQCDEQLKELRSGSLLDVIFNEDPEWPDVDNTHWTQPAMFAIHYGLAELLLSWGLKPDVVLGHSVGQYAAACIAGIMDWSDGLKLIAERGRLIGELPVGGKMLAVFSPEADVQQVITEIGDISLAATNGTHVVVSGTVSSVGEVKQVLNEKGIRTKELVTSHAFHSQLMDPALHPFEQFAAQFQFKPAQIPLVCNVTGSIMSADQIVDGKYWATHIREGVRFSESIDAINEFGCDLMIELGPQAVLTRMAAANWHGPASALIGCLNKGHEDELSIRKMLAAAYTHGVTPDFSAIHSNYSRQKVQLPTYPFQRRRFWGPDKPRAFHAEYHTAHPLLGSPVSLAGIENEERYQGFIDADSPAWMPDHEVMGSTVMPGAAFMEMALQVSGNRVVKDVVFEQPLRPKGRTALQTIVRKNADQNGQQGNSEAELKLETYSCAPGSESWVRNFSALIGDTIDMARGPIDREAIQARCDQSETSEKFYAKLNSLGLNYGPSFQVVDELHYSQSEVLTRIVHRGDIRGYTIPPTVLDGALHSLAVGILSSDDDHLFLPVAVGQIECFQSVADEMWCYARWTNDQGKYRTADVTLCLPDGSVAVRLQDLKVQQVSLSVLRQMSGSGSERLIFELGWKPTRLNEVATQDRHFMIIHSSGNCLNEKLSVSIAEHIEQFGNTTSLVKLGTDTAQTTENGYEFPTDQIEQWKQLLDQFSDRPVHGICWLVDSASFQKSRDECRRVIDFVQALLHRGQRRLECGIQLVTTNAISSDLETDSIVDPNATQFWGLGRVLGAEQPELRCRLIDVCVDEIAADNCASLVADVTVTQTADNQFAIRDGQLLVPRMKSSKLEKTGKERFSANADGCYLVTGGLGHLGRQVARWLAQRGARQIVLVSRSQPDQAAQAFIDSIQEFDCQVIIHSADISDRKDVSQLFARFDSDLKSLAGVVHAAGVLDDGLIESQTWDRIKKVLAPKSDAAALLHEFTADKTLDLFVLYSSAASILGSPGQSNYAMGNAYLDGLAWNRRKSGLPCVSINWGPWSAGMADDEKLLKRLTLQGINPLSVEPAHSAMEQLLGSQAIQALVMDVDWRRMRIGPGGEAPPMLQDLAGKRKQTAASESALVKQLKQMTGSARRELVVKTIQDSLQQILSTPGAPETDRPLIEMGLDSLMAVEFATALQQMLGEQFAVGPTMLFDHPTIDAISDYIIEMIATDTSKPEIPAQDSASPLRVAKKEIERDEIAIIGMSCRFPGAENIHEFWQNLLEGVDSVRDIPNDRWDVDRFYSADREPGKMYSCSGGFLDDIGGFDARFFNISDQEACWIDPQHRMLLENSYRAMEDAGLATQPLADPNVGVFMGIMGQDYAFLPTLDNEAIIRGFQGAGLSHSAGVGRISYMFGFEGPSVAIDTASSSSLVAVYQAMRSLQEGNCNLALAGGVNAILAPVNSLLMSQAGLLSPDGRCKSFSKQADGFGRGEGCGVVVLKRLADARRDGDRIMAVIRGGAVVHNGFSGGITSPNSKAQARVIDTAIKDAGIAPSAVQYLEAHGTGTEYGDPMELGAAVSIYGKGRKPDQPLLIGSVKANISHLEAAGGSSGLIKTVLALYHGIIPRQIHCNEPSPHIPWKRMPVQIVTETTQWPECKQRLAGVTALGLVGTNAHLVLGSDEATEERENANEQNSDLLIFSARSSSALQKLANSYLKFLRHNNSVSLSDVCYTTSVGRRHHEYRAAIGFSGRDDLIRSLGQFDTASLSQSHETAQSTSADNNGIHGVHFDMSPHVFVGRSASNKKMGWLFPDYSANPAKSDSLKQLYQHQSVVKTFVDGLDERLSQHLTQTSQKQWSIRDLINDDSQAEDHRMLRQYVAQASMVKLAQSWNIEVDAVAGLGIGHYTAACVAGCMCFLDALILVFEREQRINSDNECWNEFEQLADRFNFYPPNLQLVCSMSGDVVPIHRSLGGSYWRQHADTEVAVSASLETFKSLDCFHYLVFGNTSETTDLDSEIVKRSIHWQCKSQAAKSVMALLGKLYVCGCNPDFTAVYDEFTHRPVSLPCYPFEKKRYWITEIADHMETAKRKEAQATS